MIYLVGEAPPRSRMRDSLDSLPFSGASGRRLSEMIGRDVTEAFHTKNVLSEWPGAARHGSLFPVVAARSGVVKLIREFEHDARVILVGSRVAKAFKLRDVELFEWRHLRYRVRVSDTSKFRRTRDLWMAKIPHPSGVSLWWNDPQNPPKVKAFLLESLLRESLAGDQR